MQPGSRRVVARTLGTVVGLIVLGMVAFGGISLARAASNARSQRAERESADCARADDPTDTRNLCLYPTRTDRQPDDHEAEVGDGVRLAGYTATLEEGFINDLIVGDQLTIRVRLENRDTRSQPYGPPDWRVLSTGSLQVSPTTNARDDALGSGQLEPGEVVEGTISYDLPPGSYYVVFRPDLLNRARGVWRVTIEK